MRKVIPMLSLAVGVFFGAGVIPSQKYFSAKPCVEYTDVSGELGAYIKQRSPEYANISDQELGNRVIKRLFEQKPMSEVSMLPITLPENKNSDLGRMVTQMFRETASLKDIVLAVFLFKKKYAIIEARHAGTTSLIDFFAQKDTHFCEYW